MLSSPTARHVPDSPGLSWSLEEKSSIADRALQRAKNEFEYMASQRDATFVIVAPEVGAGVHNRPNDWSNRRLVRLCTLSGHACFRASLSPSLCDSMISGMTMHAPHDLKNSATISRADQQQARRRANAQVSVRSKHHTFSRPVRRCAIFREGTSLVLKLVDARGKREKVLE